MKRTFLLLITLFALGALWAANDTLIVINPTPLIPVQIGTNLTARTYVFVGAKGTTNNTGTVWIRLSSSTNDVGGIPQAAGAVYTLPVATVHVQDFWVKVGTTNDGVTVLMVD